MKADARVWERLQSQGEQLFFNEVEGRLWASNSYWACEVTDALKHLLGEFNLPAEPMSTRVGFAITRTETPAPRMESLVTGAESERATLQRSTIGGADVFYEDKLHADKRYGIWRTDSLTVCLDNKYASFLSSLHGFIEWQAQSSDRKPVVGVADGRIVALLMPVRLTDYQRGDLFIFDPLPEFAEAAS